MTRGIRLAPCTCAALATAGLWACADHQAVLAGSDPVDATDAPDTGRSCPTGLTPCGTECFSLLSSAAHCGRCDHACAPNQICRMAECVLDCPPGGPFVDCGGEACASLDSDPASCGACGRACAAAETCSCGECVAACHDLNTDDAHCGTCDTACAAHQVCCCGVCLSVPTCPPGCSWIPIPDQTPCGPDGRSCVDLRRDALGCGACGVECMPTQRCGDGVCTSDACEIDEVHCQGRCTNLSEDESNCGRCGNTCNIVTEHCGEGGLCHPW